MAIVVAIRVAIVLLSLLGLENKLNSRFFSCSYVSSYTNIHYTMYSNESILVIRFLRIHTMFYVMHASISIPCTTLIS